MWDQANSPIPFVEKKIHRVPFDSVLGGTAGPVTVTLVSPLTFNPRAHDPFVSGAKPFWDTNRDIAKKYWPATTYIAGCLVRATSVPDDAPEDGNPIRTTYFGRMIWDQVREGYMDTEFLYSPHDSQEGRNLTIRRDQAGAFPRYTAKFSSKTTALTEQDLADIERWGLPDLQALLGAPPSADEVKQMALMFEDSLNGEPFDQSKYPSFTAQEVGGNGGGGNGAAVASATTTTTSRAGRAASLRPIEATTTDILREINSRNTSLVTDE